ncbi:phage tail protein [Nocardia fluminea]|uniref:phage tail protein n=1 Tax=Nocardia fluminea TaxID=134984 RepID=UPI00364FD771
MRSEDYQSAGRSGADRLRSGFMLGISGIGTGIDVVTKGLSLFVINAGTIATGFGIAAKIVKGFSAATFVSAVALQAVASTGLAKLAGALRLIAAIASRVAKEIGQITSAFLVLQGVVRVIGFMTNFAGRLAKMTVGAAAAIGVISGLATIVGGALSAALSAGVMALGAFAGAAAGLGGPAIFALKTGMKGLADGAKDFNKQFSDADETFNKMIGQRMGPMLTAFRTMRMEMVDRFSKELEPAFARVGVGIDQVRGKFGWMSVYLGQIGQDIAMSLTGPGTIEAFQKMGDASGVFFQHLNQGESGLGGLSSGLVTFASTAAATFQDSSRGLNDMFLNLGEKLRSITPEQIRGALSQFRQVFQNISNVAGPLIQLFMQMGRISAQALAPGFVAIGNAIREATPGLLNMANIIMPAVGRVMQELAPLIPRLVEAFTPWATTLATIAPHLASLVANMAPLAPYLLLIATGFKIAGAVMLLWNAAAFAGAVASGVFAAAMGRTLPVTHGSTVALVANRVALLAGSVAAHAFGVAWKAATGPIGLIILAVAAIGVALYAFFTKTETGKKLWDKIWTGIKTAVSATWAFLGPIFSAIGSWFTQTLVPAVMDFWHGAIEPAFAAIGSLISSWWTGVVQPAFEGLKTVLGIVGGVISWWWTSIVSPAFSAAGAVISWFWDNIGSPIFENFKTGLGLVGDAISWWWNSIVGPAFSAAGTTISYFWDNVGSPIFNNLKTIIGLVGDAISWWWNSIVSPAFSAAGAMISWFWDSIGSPVFENFKTGLGVLGEAFSWFKDNIIDPVFDGIGTAISFAWDNVVSPIFDKIKSGIGLVGDAFGAAGGVIKTMWGGIADILRPAVHFLGNILAKVPSSIGGFEIPGAGIANDLGNKMLSFRSGGLAVGPGTGTSDSILAAISNGEFIVRAQYAKQFLPLLEAINNGRVPAYATGGMVDVQNFLKGEAGKKYQYGGTGNPSWDCSGIAGAAWAKAAGKPTGARYFTTDSNFAALGWQSGPGGEGDITIGTNGGSGSGGHMSGRAGGLKFESSGTDGVEVGPGAQDPSAFPTQWHWPVGGNPLGGGTGGANSGGTGGLGTGGGTSGAGGTGTSGGASSSGAATSRPSGVAIPVWVDNMPSTLSSTSTATSSASNDTTGASPSSVSPTSDNTDGSFDQAAAVNAAFEKFNGSMASAGSDWTKGQKSSIPGIGSSIEGIEKTVNNWQIVTADVWGAFDRVTREQKRQTAGKG